MSKYDARAEAHAFVLREGGFCDAATEAHHTVYCDRALTLVESAYDAGRASATPVEPGPIPMVLHCPECRTRHVDVGEFATKVHHTHSCQGCGLTWRPAVVATVGVQFLPGFKNVDPAPVGTCNACGHLWENHTELDPSDPNVGGCIVEVDGGSYCPCTRERPATPAPGDGAGMPGAVASVGQGAQAAVGGGAGPGDETPTTADDWMWAAVVHGYNELAKQGQALGEKLYFRMAREAAQVEAEKRGVMIKVGPVEGRTVFEMRAANPHIIFHERDIEGMRAAVAAFDSRAATGEPAEQREAGTGQPGRPSDPAALPAVVEGEPAK